MAFEIFTGTGVKNRDFISITANKTFGFPRAFVDANNINDDSKVVILYDEDAKRIALYFSAKNPKFGYAFRRSKNKKHGGSVIAHGFFDAKDIDSSKYAQRYNYEKIPISELGYPDQMGDAFVIELKPKTEPVKEKIPEKTGEQPINLDDIPF